jgi:hypothetical protein
LVAQLARRRCASVAGKPFQIRIEVGRHGGIPNIAELGVAEYAGIGPPDRDGI